MSDFNLDELLIDPQPFFPITLSPSAEDVMNLSKRIDQLTIEVNIQNLTIEIERMKRRRLRSLFKLLKSEVLSLKQTTAQIQADNNVLKEQIFILSTTLFSEIACLITRVHCCLGRIHQILIAAVHYIGMPEGEHREIAQLLYELLRAV